MKLETLLNRLYRYNTVKQWISGIEYRESGMAENTLSLYLYYLEKYCEFMDMDPDEIMEERMQHLQSSNPQIKSQHDVKVQQYAKWLRDRGASPNTVSVAVAAIKSFYRYNYGGLVIKQPRSEVVNVRHVPSREEIAIVVNNPGVKRWVRAWIVAQAQSGLSLKELRTIDPVMLLDYIEGGEPPIVIPMYRGKEHVGFHTVFGGNACMLLREYIILHKPRDMLFPYNERTIQLAVREQFRRNGKYTTPHCLRKFFYSIMMTQAKMAVIEGLNPLLIEYWMGHRISKTQAAYFVPSIERQRKIYRQIEDLITFF